MTETLANGYSSDSAQREQSNAYQHDRVSTVYKNLCIFALLTKVASALEGLRHLLGVACPGDEKARSHWQCIKRRTPLE